MLTNDIASKANQCSSRRAAGFPTMGGAGGQTHFPELARGTGMIPAMNSSCKKSLFIFLKLNGISPSGSGATQWQKALPLSRLSFPFSRLCPQAWALPGRGEDRREVLWVLLLSSAWAETSPCPSGLWSPVSAGSPALGGAPGPSLCPWENFCCAPVSRPWELLLCGLLSICGFMTLAPQPGAGGL